jgi:hypothetical protein
MRKLQTLVGMAALMRSLAKQIVVPTAGLTSDRNDPEPLIFLAFQPFNWHRQHFAVSGSGHVATGIIL